jgi:phosphate-selective porin OprO/OprP
MPSLRPYSPIRRILSSVSLFALISNTPAFAAEVETEKRLQALERRIEQLEKENKALSDQVVAAPNAAPPALPPSNSGPHDVESAAHKFSVASADGKYSIGLTGIVQTDFGGYLNFQPRSNLSGPQHLTSGINVRRARIGVAGKVFGDWSYTFIYDTGNSQDTTAGGIEAAQVSYTGFKGVIIDLPGYSATPFTMEQATSSSDLMFLERSTPTNLAIGLNAGDSRTNTGVHFIGDRYWVGAYFTGPASGDSHTGLSERFGAFQRATYQVLAAPDYSLHLGVAADELLQAPNTGVGTANAVTLNDRPELRIDPTSLLTTGSLGTVANPVTGDAVYGIEAAGGWQSLFFQGEYFLYRIDRRGLATASFDGGYAQISYTLTGEHRAYNRTSGAYGGIVPADPFSISGGIGAWEVAARVSYAGLTDNFTPKLALSAQPDAVNGGRQIGYTAALNWYPNTLMRLMVNYVHTDFKKLNGVPMTGLALGAGAGAKADAVAGRIQFAF